MKWLSGLLFVFLASTSYAQDIEMRVINDEVMWPVDSSSRPDREDWWLINDSGDADGPIRITVILGQPYCDKQDVEPCEPYEWSQKLEVRAIEDENRKLSSPFYLLKGNLAWQRARQISLRKGFDTTADLSEIEVSLDGQDYVLSRTLSGDKSRIAVSVRSGAIVQEIHACRTGGSSYPVCGDEGFEEILWAGDLDGDGELDILAQFTEKYSVRNYHLYTSGNAGQGELVALSAEYGRNTE